MERKTLTLKRPSAEKSEVSIASVVPALCIQTGCNQQPAKSTLTPAKKQDANVNVDVPEVPDKKPVISQDSPENALSLDDAITVLSGCWPQLFPEGILRPMAVGTREALLTDKKVKELAISYKTIKHCLATISRSVKYRATIMPGAVRYDKDGQPKGTVTEPEFADTLKRIQKLARQQS